MKTVRDNGLELAAIENFSPRFWSDVLLGGPERARQIEGLKRLVRDAGRAGIPCIGYNFSIAGVWGWSRGPFARGEAMSVGLDLAAIDPDLPLPDGVVWNMRYRAGRPEPRRSRSAARKLWERLGVFLREIVPVAEEAGVMMAAHPDDPPAEALRGTARLVNRPEKYDRLMDIVDSPANGLELCLGSLQEMPGPDGIYEPCPPFRPPQAASATSTSAMYAARCRNITRPSSTTATSTWPRSFAYCATKTTRA